MLFALLLLASIADPVQVWTTNQLKTQGTSLPAGAVEGATLGSYGSHSASLWKRTSSGQAELHRTKSDLMIVQEGSATFLSGGTIVSPHPTTAGEIRGTSISNGQSRKLTAGDIVHVPPNTPHQFILDKGQSITYVAIKIGR